MRPDLPTGTVTFLFTDVEGSTRLLEEIGDEAYEDALSVHRRIVRAACLRHDGVEVDTQGDAFFFAFPEPSWALAAAQQMTEGLGAGPIQVRVGLHTGTPRLGEEGYVGSDVHFGARVAASAHGGQVVLSQATRDLVDGYVLTDLGEHRLKDIEHAVAIFQLGDESFPPLKTISNTNLPRPVSSFVGREPELAEVRALIEEQARLVTLTGPGGSGKTRLALEAASTLVPEYKAGVFWVGLAALRDPALVTETIAQTLGAKDRLAEHIGEREMLLLIDNLEQVIEAAPELSSVLQTCPNLTLLVTSRELLRVQGEVEYPVPPLASPEAVALFCERAQLNPSGEIAELCARLDNLPLAVELAAARVKVLSPVQILERVTQRLDLLKGGRDADPRQQTLRATIEWSYDLLSEEEQRLFARLSVFAGGCTLEAAEEVAEADELDTLQSLVEKSLLRFSDGRYWMLETIRGYADERLEASGESHAMKARHARYLSDVASSGSHVSAAFMRREWADRLDRERDNLRAALGWSSRTGSWEDAYRLATGFGDLCAFRGPLSEGRWWLETVLKQHNVAGALRQAALRSASSLASRQRDLEAAKALAEERLAVARQIGDSDVVGAALLTLGVAESMAANFERAEALEREALELFRRTGDERMVRETLGMLGWLLLARQSYPEASRVCAEALRMSREAADGRGIVLSGGNLGHLLAREGRFKEALELQREALVLARERFDLTSVSSTLVEIAAVAAACGEHEAAAVLVGAVSTLDEETEFVLDPVLGKTYEGLCDSLRESMDGDRLARATRRGREMQLDETVVFAVELTQSDG